MTFKGRDVLILVSVLALAGFFLARSLYGDRPTRAEMAEALVRAGDSAVALVRGEGELKDELNSELIRMLDSLRANPEIVTRIEIRRETVLLTDTFRIEILVPPTAQATDTVDLNIEPTVRDGITVTEEIRVSPPPIFFSRSLGISFDLDTLALALVRDEAGIARIISSFDRAGMNVRTIFAAEVSREKSGLSKMYDVLQPVTCLVAGWAISEKLYAVAGGTAASCLARFVF